MGSRIFNSKHLNEIANDPRIRPWLGGTGEIDLTAALSAPANFAYGDEDGGFVLMNLGYGRYEVHTILRYGVRDARTRAQEMLDYMFIHTDALEIVTKVPKNNPRAGALAAGCGFLQLWERPNGWEGQHGLSFRKLDLDLWASECYTAEVEGEAFHRKLEHLIPENHPEDQNHDMAVGVALLMVKAGNVDKALTFYNKWAVFAGYGQVQLISQNPLIIDMGTEFLVFKNGELEDIQCR